MREPLTEPLLDLCDYCSFCCYRAIIAYFPTRCGDASIPALPLLALAPRDLPDLGLADFGSSGALPEMGL